MHCFLKIMPFTLIEVLSFMPPTGLTHGSDIDRNVMDALLLMLGYQQSCSHSTRFTIIPDTATCSILRHVLACECIYTST